MAASALWPQNTPAFILRVREMRPASGAGHFDGGGHWHPPTQQGSNRIINSPNREYYYACNGERLGRISRSQFINHQSTFGSTAAPSPFETASVYYAHGNIHLVDYDAAASAVGPAAGGPSGPTTGWRRMCFTWRSDGSSKADYIGNQTRLQAQRTDQIWATRILPDGFQAHSQATSDQQVGGMNGSLPLLIALLVLRYPRTVDLEPVYRQRRWALGSEHREDRRGLIVETWTWPGRSNRAILEAFERGQMGKIFS